MSSFLYRLGRWSFAHRWRVLAAWLIVLALGGGGALAFGQGTNDTFTIPGTQSQQALDQLSRTFPEVSGGSAQIIVVAAPGHTITQPVYRSDIGHAVSRMGKIHGVRAVTSPYDDQVKGLLSADGEAALVRIQLVDSITTVPQSTKDAITHANAELQKVLPAGSQSRLGGDLYSQTLPTISPIEAVGLLIAIVVLVLAFRSFVAAGMPLGTALLGVGVSMTLIFLSTAFGTISSTTPMLALMLGLAVGIDYALFIISRHIQQLRRGMDPQESVATAVATSGSAVVFAGTTVLIALVGLAIARIPFLTTMGIAAAAAVLIAVLIALTLTPAFLGFARHRLTPSPRAIERERARIAAVEAGGRGGFFRGWVRAVTRFPLATVLAVVALLAIASAPALGLRLALPDAGMLPAGNQARQSYDLVARHFGAGANGPLIVTGTIIQSTDPVALMNDIGRDLGRMKGVQEIALATPNQTADTGIVQVVPTTGPDSPATTRLVQRIRDRHGYFLRKYDVDLAVTGQTAAAIDISSRLGQALLPFGIFVVGLSLVLLAMVFRSVWVPIKATAGYLLSVGAAFGAVTWVFVDGGMAKALGVSAVGPVISFLPIILMGVLFGLAMDYEVFLVSRMREEYVRGGRDPHRAIERGFVGSAPVVTAAALIMFGVFAAFVPDGDTSIKPIALGLAVGVFADAFLVRMTLVPAILALLGRRAWWMPHWLERVLPSFDVEGEAIAHELALAGWPGTPAAVAVRGQAPDAGLLVAPGERVVLEEASGSASPLLAGLAGRLRHLTGDVKVLGYVMPGRAGAVRRRVGLASLAGGDPPLAVERALASAPELLFLDDADRVLDPPAAEQIRRRLDEWSSGGGRTIIAAARDGALAAHVLTDSLGAPARVVPVDAGGRILPESADAREITAPDDGPDDAVAMRPRRAGRGSSVAEASRETDRDTREAEGARQ